MTLPEFLLADGFTAQIYEWGDNYILKLYHAWMDPDIAEIEYTAISTANHAGIQVPQVRGVIDVNGRPGIILERLDGINLSTCLHINPLKLFSYSRLFAELLISIHGISPQFLRPQKKYISNLISTIDIIPIELKTKIINYLEKLPDCDRLCHGDFHIGNVIMTSKGPVIVDWEKCTCGTPAADLADTRFFFSKAIGNIPWNHSLYRLQLFLFHYAFFNRYRLLSPEPYTGIQHWMPIIYALKLLDNPSEPQKYLDKIVHGINKS